MTMVLQILIIFGMAVGLVRGDDRSAGRSWDIFKKNAVFKNQEFSHPSERDLTRVDSAKKNQADFVVTLDKLRKLAAYFTHRGRPRYAPAVYTLVCLACVLCSEVDFISGFGL